MPRLPTVKPRQVIRLWGALASRWTTRRAATLFCGVPATVAVWLFPAITATWAVG